jgi:hypothetical protein
MLAGVTSEREHAWSELLAGTPPGWYVGRPRKRHCSRRMQSITVVLVTVAMVAGCIGMNRGHPDPNPVRGYRLEIAEGDAPFRPLNVGAQGEGCEA